MMEEKIPNSGVAAFALMAAGGDLGAAFAPQLVGVVADAVSTSSICQNFAMTFGISPEQTGLKAGMLFCSLFGIIGAIVVLIIRNRFKKHE